MKMSNFDKLLERYLTDKVSESERIKIEAWLKVMKTERETDLEMSAEAEDRLFQKITNPQEDVKEVVALYPKKSLLHKAFAPQWVRIAASVIILLSVSFTIWTVVNNNQVNRLASATKEKLILNDGTLVWLKPGSQFTYYQKNGVRQANLTGEAFFEVAKIPNSTFTITCGDINVKVLGTSFSLKTESSAVELKVLTGKVNLSSQADATGISVTANEKVVYKTTGVSERTPLPQNEAQKLTAGTEYNMLFENTAMDEVIASMEKKFNVTITVQDQHLLQCHVKVDLTDSSLENTLTTLTHVLDINYSINKNKVELVGTGCK